MRIEPSTCTLEVAKSGALTYYAMGALQVLTVVCIISSSKPLFSAWSAFSLPGIPVWEGIQLIVGLCLNLDSASLMALVIVFKSYCLVCLQPSKSMCVHVL